MIAFAFLSSPRLPVACYTGLPVGFAFGLIVLAKNSELVDLPPEKLNTTCHISSNFEFLHDKFQFLHAKYSTDCNCVDTLLYS